MNCANENAAFFLTSNIGNKYERNKYEQNKYERNKYECAETQITRKANCAIGKKQVYQCENKTMQITCTRLTKLI